MKRMILALSLAGLTLLASATDASAQRRGGYGGGGFGGGNRGWNQPGISFGIGNNGRVNIPFGNSGYYGNQNYGYGQGYGYGSNYGYSPSYYSAPSTYYVEPAIQTREVYYPAPTATQQSSNVMVLVPNPDAQVWFDNAQTSQRGMERTFTSPQLEPNHNYTYTIKARWTENGKTIDRQRQVTFQAGQSVTVNFRENTGESISPPAPRN